MKGKERPVARKRSKKQVRLEPGDIVHEKPDFRTWGSEILLGIGWVLTFSLCALVAAGVELWVVFEVGFAAAGVFGMGLGWKIAEEVLDDGC